MPASPIKITGEGIIYRNPRPHVKSRHAYFPWMISAENGDLIASFVLGEAFESVDCTTYVSRSSDQGQTWSEPKPILPEDKRVLKSDCARISYIGSDHLATIMVQSDRSAHPDEGLANPDNMGFAPTQLLSIHSYDRGVSWIIDGVIHPPLEGPSFEACNAITVLSNGRWVWTTSTWKGWDGYNPNGMKMIALVSSDQGRTWDEYWNLMDGTADQIIYWEGKLLELSDGRLFSTAWAYDEKNGVDLPNQYAISADGGKTWSKPASMNILGQTMATTVLKDQRIVVVYRRMDQPGLWMNFLKLEGAELQEEASIRLWNGIQSTQKNANMVTEFNELKFGAPCITKLTDTTLMISFWCYEKMVSNIRWIKVEI
jgi:sialidase-1